jgi:hypothetical protein
MIRDKMKSKLRRSDIMVEEDQHKSAKPRRGDINPGAIQ